MAKKGRSIPEINAGSMADIAFLLLIFFLVTTSIDTDKGIAIRLPPKVIIEQDIRLKQRNVLEVLINANNDLLVEKKLLDISQLTEMTKRHITNNGLDPNLSESPDNAIVSLKADRGTEYQAYIMVQNELKRAYNELREAASQEKYGRSYADLPDDSKMKETISKMYPQKISEAEPEDAFNQK